MSNNKKIIKKLNKIKPIKEKYILFNEFLNDLENRKSKESSIDSNNKNNSLPVNKRNLLKYAKIDGSKNFLLSATNSILSKDDININTNNINIILDNLDFISANSKYINNIQTQPQQHSSPKNNFKNNDFFSSSTSSISQKNLFFINKQNIFSNIDLFTNNDDVNNNCNDLNKNKCKKNENYFNIQNIPNINFSDKNDLYKETKNIILTNEFSNNMNMSNMSLDKSHSNTSLYRQDYYIKQFKVQYSIWLRNYLNHKLKLLIEETKNCRKHLKFYPLNSLKFTANPKYEDNKYFLSLKIKEILIVGIDSIKSSNQKKNKENIETIENKIYKENKNANKDLLEFLNSSMEDSIKTFYESEQFQKFKNNEQTRLNDAKFVQEKSFSLLSDNGFIHLIKNYKGNAKSAISFIHS